jgi:transposase-like protein
MSALLVGETKHQHEGAYDMTHRKDDNAIENVLEALIDNGLEGMADAMATLMNEAMKLERSQFLGAGPHERTSERIGYANGFKDKTVRTRIGELKLAIPQVRDLPTWMDGFYPRSLERGLRSERALKLSLAEMYVNGVSTRRVKAITEQLCGFSISSTEVSRAAELLDEELEAWRTRPVGEVPYLVLDARYEKVRHGGQVRDCAVLLAVGVRDDGKRSILGVSVSLSEAEVHWRAFLSSLMARGMHGTCLVVSDDHEGLKAARKATLPSVPWQRCQFHLQQNAQAYVPRVAMRREVAEAIRAVFHAPDRVEADRMLARLVECYQKSAPKLVEWAEENLPEGLAVFQLPLSHRRRLQTVNGLERLNKEIARRTRVATLFPNEASLLRLVSALLVEISEEWETGRIYINLESNEA